MFWDRSWGSSLYSFDLPSTCLCRQTSHEFIEILLPLPLSPSAPQPPRVWRVACWSYLPLLLTWWLCFSGLALFSVAYRMTTLCFIFCKLSFQLFSTTLFLAISLAWYLCLNHKYSPVSMQYWYLAISEAAPPKTHTIFCPRCFLGTLVHWEMLYGVRHGSAVFTPITVQQSSSSLSSQSID